MDRRLRDLAGRMSLACRRDGALYYMAGAPEDCQTGRASYIFEVLADLTPTDVARALLTRATATSVHSVAASARIHYVVCAEPTAEPVVHAIAALRAQYRWACGKWARRYGPPRVVTTYVAVSAAALNATSTARRAAPMTRAALDAADLPTLKVANVDAVATLSAPGDIVANDCTLYRVCE